MEHRELTEQIIGFAMKVHSQLGSGFLESVFRNALIHELRKAGRSAEAERRIAVEYDCAVVGEFVADIMVENLIIVELKALSSLLPAHEAQLVNYLAATKIEFGLLLNFGSGRLEFKRKTRTYRKRVPIENFTL
jgi:GxxExxY protein